jgi:DNA (cytosine-5)-methyltransferase 3A
MKVLSLFDGISCGRVALERAGIPVETYYASEIDKYAMSVAQAMYPDTIQIGDVCKIDFTQYIGKVDMIIGGSPCQDLSIAKQNRQGLQGERSRLFWEYIKALTIIKPKYFLLENVASMKNEDRDAITAVLRGIYPETECVMINSALVSAQQRKRYYWTNWHVEQPQDKGILLKDILESGLPYLEKSQSLTASYDGAVFWNSIQRKQRTMVAEPVRIGEIGKGGQGNRIYSVRGKSVCLNANGGGRGAKTGLYKIDLPDGDYIVRKLTPRECARLQTYPERCFDVANISNTQWYKAFGNGWTVDVIAHIFKQIPTEN